MKEFYNNKDAWHICTPWEAYILQKHAFLASL